MAEVTQELVDEVLKALQARLAQVDGELDEMNAREQARRSQMIGVQHGLTAIHQEIAGMHQTLIRHEERLDRIGRRLELSESTMPTP